MNQVESPDASGGRTTALESLDAQKRAAGRIASVDALRGLTIFVMIFVNDLGHVAPAWLHHIQPSTSDGMTLADVVFPAFLFLVGVSIPLAFERAQLAGRSKWGQLGHVLLRTAGLLLMGVIVVNSEEDVQQVGVIWIPLAFAALVLAACAVPREPGGKRTILLFIKAAGIVGLLILVAIYRREPATARFPPWEPVEGWVWLRSSWWGILGLIGWAYLTVGLLVLVLGRRREWLMGAMALLLTIHVAMTKGGLLSHLDSKPWLGEAAGPLASVAHGIDTLGQYVSLSDATGSLAAITMAGCLLGTILRRDSDVPTHRGRLSWALTFSVGLLVAGCIADTFEGINKNAATPTWCLWSAALTCLTWVVLYLLLDVADLRAWSLPLRAAGANPLVAYFLHPIIVESISVAGLGATLLAYKDSSDPWVVVGGSLGMAAVVCIAAGILGRLGLRMRL
jgi:heparan-alpha-glucosaminide N-acetyltransferase